MKAGVIRKSGIAIAATVVLSAATAVVAYATIPSPGGVIHGCYLTSTGVLRVIDSSVTKCAKKETSLNWNSQGIQGVQGVQGVQGFQGVQGVPGPPGPSGSSHGYIASTNEVVVAQDPAFSSGGSVNSVPAGTYMIWADANFADSLNEPFETCAINLNGVRLPNTATQINLKSGKGDLSIVSAATLTGGGSTVEVVCSSDDNTAVVSVNLSLMEVDALN